MRYEQILDIHLYRFGEIPDIWATHAVINIHFVSMACASKANIINVIPW